MGEACESAGERDDESDDVEDGGREEWSGVEGGREGRGGIKGEKAATWPVPSARTRGEAFGDGGALGRTLDRDAPPTDRRGERWRRARQERREEREREEEERGKRVREREGKER